MLPDDENKGDLPFASNIASNRFQNTKHIFLTANFPLDSGYSGPTGANNKPKQRNKRTKPTTSHSLFPKETVHAGQGLDARSPAHIKTFKKEEYSGKRET